METIVDYLNHFSRKLFAQSTSAAMTVTDERAAGTTQQRFTFLPSLPLFPSLLVLFFPPHLRSVVLGIVRSFIWELILCLLKEGGGDDDEGEGDIFRDSFLSFPTTACQTVALQTQQLESTKPKEASH